MSKILDEAILKILPTSHHEVKWLSTPEVMERLEAAGHNIGYLKKVRRRLEAMKDDRMVVATQDDGKREILWQRTPWLTRTHDNASLMDASEAVAFHMLERFVTKKLPKAVVGDIDNLFRAAEVRLSQEKADSRLHRAWADKVDTVDGTFALRRPELNDDIFSVIKTATFFERVIKVRYMSLAKASGGEQPKLKPLWPLALVESAGAMYMVAQHPEHKPDPDKGKLRPLRSVFRLDRVLEAVETEETFEYPKDFKLRTFIDAEQQFNFMVEPKVHLRLAFDSHSGDHLLASPMSSDQEDTRLDDGRLVIEGTVMPSLKLRWWLRSFGSSVEVLAPQSLRDEFAAEYRKLAEKYG